MVSEAIVWCWCRPRPPAAALYESVGPGLLHREEREHTHSDQRVWEGGSDGGTGALGPQIGVGICSLLAVGRHTHIVLYAIGHLESDIVSIKRVSVSL